MKLNIRNGLRVKQKITWQKAVLITSVAFTMTALTVIILQLKNPEIAKAASCQSTYALNWSDPTSYTVSCGTVNSAHWSVKGTTCIYYSPVLYAGGTIGDPDKAADISVAINQSGNLEANDTAWVYMYANNSIVKTFRCIGDSITSVFTTTHTITVPAGGNYKIVIKLQNDKTNEVWQVKDGDVTCCLRTLDPLPIVLENFTAAANSSDKVELNWTTNSEINNDYFTLERSKTGDLFEPLTTIPGAGNSSTPKNYSFIDENPLDGINYYRLSQTGFDGTTTILTVVQATVSRIKEAINGIVVYPNPFKGNFTVKFDSENDQEVTVRLVTMDGRVLFKEVCQVNKGINTVSCAPSEKIKGGNYIIQVVNSVKVIGSAKAICK